MDPAQLEGWVSDIEAAEVKFIVGYMLSCFIHLLALLCLLTLNLSMFYQYEFFLRINIPRNKLMLVQASCIVPEINVCRMKSSRTHAGLGRLVQHWQEQVPPNHVQR